MNERPPGSRFSLLPRPSAFAAWVGVAVGLTSWCAASGWLTHGDTEAAGDSREPKPTALGRASPEKTILPRLMLDASFPRDMPAALPPTLDRRSRSRPAVRANSAPTGLPVDASEAGLDVDTVIVLNEGTPPPKATEPVPVPVPEPEPEPVQTLSAEPDREHPLDHADHADHAGHAGHADRLVALPDARFAVVTDPTDGMPRAVAIGGSLPSGARLLSVDPVRGTATTDRGLLELR